MPDGIDDKVIDYLWNKGNIGQNIIKEKLGTTTKISRNRALELLKA